jgi:hypothetical protein
MRLLNTSTLLLGDFFSDTVPRYAILSHRWENEEVTYQDFMSTRRSQMAGWSKITGCCRQAAADGWKYAWVDSCCIDKSSSAELSEAINSMFRWYERAEVCYAYLSDVPGHDQHPLSAKSAFRDSKWFTRGWTLQEFLAPRSVVFFNAGWVDIGTKASLEGLLSVVTGIRNIRDFRIACVARKMSWASKRETTRVEDKAYCLMGLFGVHMPPLYGEGENAFLRLQMEILSNSDDDSIFAWKNEDVNKMPYLLGMLAPSPQQFNHCQNVEQIRDILGVLKDREPWAMTSKGFRMQHIVRPDLESHFNEYYSLLNCRLEDTYQHLAIGMLTEGPDGAKRIGQTLTTFGPDDFTDHQRRTWYVKQGQSILPSPRPLVPFTVRFGQLLQHDFKLSKISRPTTVDSVYHSSENHIIEDGELRVLVRHHEPIVLIFTCGQHVAAVLLTTAHDHAWTTIMTKSQKSQKDRWREEDLDSFVDTCELRYINMAASEEYSKRPDRSSKQLGSGTSVEVIIKRKIQDEREEYFVDITADPTGHLRWPDFSVATFSNFDLALLQEGPQ